mmetsp:Transcript_150597/g.419762  ORF Transcript_150597/g.419762 Transcript_150597/m.419762 type:complete len:231 (+) Transcript_150597:89-781(+)
MGETQTCAIHGKNRAMRYLTEESPGRYVCMAGFECKAAGSGAGNDRVQCVLHGKLRSLDCLQDDGTGRLICTPERRCKTTGSTMPDFRDRDKAVGGGQQLGFGMPNPYAAYGPGPFGAPQYPQVGNAQYGGVAAGGCPFPGSQYVAPVGPYAGYAGMPGVYPQYGGYPMFPGMVWPYGTMPSAGSGGGEDQPARSRSRKRQQGDSSKKRRSRSKRRRRRSPSTSSSSRSR